MQSMCNRNNFIYCMMEQSVKSVGNPNLSYCSRPSPAYTSNRIRQNSLIKPSQKYVTSFSSIMGSSKKGQSLNKINSLKNNSKVDIIKFKCMQKRKMHTKAATKQFSHPKAVEDDDLNISYDLEQQTDDTVITKAENSQILLKKSKFNGRPPTVFFQYPKCCDQTNQEILNSNRIYSIPKATMFYKINGSQYKCIVNTLQFNGFTKCQYGNQWNVYFDIKGTKTKKVQHMVKHQKISHFPGCWYIGRKDFMWRGINKKRRTFPDAYNFTPITYLLPSDFQRFQMARENANKGELWILKPAAAACGRGIKMIAKDTKVRNRKEYLISQYIANPHLINNLKYDLRVYVLVTSYDPLRIYIFQDGLVRFATHQYTNKTRDIKRRFVHLTNFSVNKHSKNFVKNSNSQQDGKGSKWSFQALRKYYQQNGIDSKKLFQKIEDVIIKTCISSEPNMLDIHSKSTQKRTCCFEIYGFDILIDDNLKPWLMQVNVCPSLSSSSPMDRKIKHTLLTDVLNLIGIEYNSMKQHQKIKKKLKQNFIKLQGGRKLFSRNFNNLQMLNYDNCIEILSPDDWLVLFESEEQLDRLGNFKKIFPTQKNCNYYQQFFEYKRYNNIMLWKYLQNGSNFFERIYSS